MTKFSTVVESFEVSRSKEDGVSVSGLALPFDKVSRNGFTYVKESIQDAYQSLIGAPVLFNHNTENVIGHVGNVSLSGEGMTYEMNLDPEEPIARKVARKDLTKVSIQCIYDEEKSYIDEEGITHAYIREFLELSVVSIPGFADTTAQVVENLQNKKPKLEGTEKMSEQEIKPDEQTPAPEPKDEKQVTEESDSDMEDRIAALEKQVAAMSDKLSEMDDSEEEPKTEEAEDEETPEEDEEKKVEEAIKENKKTISAESIKPQKVILTKEELKKNLMELL